MTGVGHVVLTFSLEGCRGWIYLACCLQRPSPPQPPPNLPQTTPDLWCRCPTNPKLCATPYTSFIHNVPGNKRKHACLPETYVPGRCTACSFRFVHHFHSIDEHWFRRSFKRERERDKEKYRWNHIYHVDVIYHASKHFQLLYQHCTTRM